MSANTTTVKVKKTDLSGTSTAYKAVAVVILILLVIFFLFPLYWIVTGSFKDVIEINSRVPIWFPQNPTVDNYARLFENPAFLWLFNIVFISAMAMLLTCITAALAGYALGKKRFYGRAILFTIIICAMALPKQVIVIPLAQEMKLLHLSDTLWAVILPTVGWPFGVFLMKQFSETIPNEILEAARVDGAGELKTFFSVVFPMIKPGIGALAIFTFVNTWNDYFLQLVMLTSKEKWTLPLAIANLQGEMSSDFGLIMAGAALAVKIYHCSMLLKHLILLLKLLMLKLISFLVLLLMKSWKMRSVLRLLLPVLSVEILLSERVALPVQVITTAMHSSTAVKNNRLLLLRSRDKLLRMVLVLSNRQPPILKFRLGFAVKLTNANSLCLCKGSFSISWAYMIEIWMKNTRYCLNKLKVMI